MSEATLPPGWVAKRSRSHPNLVYYANAITRTSTWDDPRLDSGLNKKAAEVDKCVSPTARWKPIDDKKEVIAGGSSTLERKKSLSSQRSGSFKPVPRALMMPGKRHSCDSSNANEIGKGKKSKHNDPTYGSPNQKVISDLSSTMTKSESKKLKSSKKALLVLISDGEDTGIPDKRVLKVYSDGQKSRETNGVHIAKPYKFRAPIVSKQPSDVTSPRVKVGTKSPGSRNAASFACESLRMPLKRRPVPAVTDSSGKPKQSSAQDGKHSEDARLDVSRRTSASVGEDCKSSAAETARQQTPTVLSESSLPSSRNVSAIENKILQITWNRRKNKLISKPSRWDVTSVSQKGRNSNLSGESGVLKKKVLQMAKSPSKTSGSTLSTADRLLSALCTETKADKDKETKIQHSSIVSATYSPSERSLLPLSSKSLVVNKKKKMCKKKVKSSALDSRDSPSISSASSVPTETFAQKTEEVDLEKPSLYSSDWTPTILKKFKLAGQKRDDGNSGPRSNFLSALLAESIQETKRTGSRETLRQDSDAAAAKCVNQFKFCTSTGRKSPWDVIVRNAVSNDVEDMDCELLPAANMLKEAPSSLKQLSCREVLNSSSNHNTVPMDVEISDAEGIVTKDLHDIRKHLQSVGSVQSGQLSGLLITPVKAPAARNLLRLFIVLDTNILMYHLKFIDELKDHDISGLGRPTLVVPWVVMQELDGLKGSNRASKLNKLCSVTQTAAQSAVDYLYASLKSKHPRIVGQTAIESAEKSDYLIVECNDDRILKCYFQYMKKYPKCHVVLFTNDKNLCAKSMISGVKAYNKQTLSQGLRELTPLNAVADGDNPPRAVDASASPSASAAGFPPLAVQQEVSLQSGQVQQALTNSSDMKDQPQTTDQDNAAALSILVAEVMRELWRELRRGLAGALESEMKLAYDDLWLSIVFRKPPWSLSDVLTCILNGLLFDSLGVSHALVYERSGAALPGQAEAEAFLVRLLPTLQQLRAGLHGIECYYCCFAEGSDRQTEELAGIPDNYETVVLKAFQTIWQAINNFCGLLFDSLGVSHALVYERSGAALSGQAEAEAFLVRLLPTLQQLRAGLHGVITMQSVDVSKNNEAFSALCHGLVSFFPNLLDNQEDVAVAAVTAAMLQKFCTSLSNQQLVVNGYQQLQSFVDQVSACELMLRARSEKPS
ncbi:PREDICTED: uncharacterized protein LOC106816347 [Priapulus caudatus]|uniref:Uncharacterized protein LOC106816347 n=1 Tax=Priapulus caudatus TaxID=37621 RepID=A0ABM1EW39_PRICU|nr:PREDICTED: uncharacterized protein LOC106816347 [Priapulus caudatus]